MILHTSISDLTGIHSAVVTTGSFDGVHVGHKAIIRRINQIAKENHGESALVTFYPHPRKILYPEAEGKDLQMIYSQNEKISLLDQTGLDHLIIIPFTPEFSKTSSADFVNHILLEKIHAQVIVVGFNHYFGYQREGNYEYLHALSKVKNFRVEEIPEQEIQHETVSSTKIRKALHQGNIQRANAYLDHFYFIQGSLSEGNQNLATLGFDTYSVTIEEEDKLIPPEGVYAIRLITTNNSFRGMVNIIRSKGASTNTHYIEFNLFEKIDPQTVKDGKILFYKRIRDIKIFHSHLDLQMQLIADKAEVEELVY